MTQAKKSAPPVKAPSKKLKSKKLEERIAPGMVGGGVVDPGMADSTDSSSEDSSASYSETETSLSTESMDSNTDTGGQYLPEENTSPSFQQEGFNEPAPTEPVPMAEASAPDATSFDNADLAPSGDYVVEPESWREPDWVTANADGSVTVQPPAGVSIENGVANFPMAVANDALPIPEEITIQADGSVDISLPEGAVFNEDLNQLTLPAGDSQPHDVPAEFCPVENPDGTLSLTLPEGQAEYNAETNTLNLSNAVVNDIAPSYMEINTDGSVSVTLPEDTQVNTDGSFTIPADNAHYFDNPPPEYVQEVEFCDYQPDGSVTVELPQGATVEAGIAEFPYAVAVDHLPIPEEVTLNSDGSMNVELPQGANYNPDLNALNMPADHFNPADIPEGISYYGNPDGSWTVPLPDGMTYDSASNSVEMSNYWANEFAPDHVQIGTDGAVSVELPPTTEYHADGTFSIPADSAHFMETPAPDYVHDAPYSEPMMDGGYSVTPPEGVTIQETPYGTQMQFTYDAVAENVPLPHDIEILPDGAIAVPVPEGTQYDAEFNRLTFPMDAVNMNEIPEGVPAHVNPDGTLCVTLPDGITYQPEAGNVVMSNYWANEFAPPSVEITPAGGVYVTMPPTVDYQPDGSMIIPPESADFLQSPDPAYMTGAPEWVAANPDGSITFTPPATFTVDPEAGTMTASFEQYEQNFQAQIPDDLVVHPDGSMEAPVPAGSVYDSASNTLTIPAADMQTKDIPAGIAYEVLDSGAYAVQLPPGIEYDPASQTVTLNNHWANEFAPPNVEIMPNGQIQVDLPPQTQYFEGGDAGFAVPPTYADFIDNPPPAYIQDGPEWANMSPDGAVHFTPPTDVQLHPETGTATMSVDSMNEHFENHIPDHVQFNPDGTVNIQMPPYVSFNADTGVLTFPADHAAEHMPPPQVMPYFDGQGNLCVALPAGIQFDAASNSVHLDNAWTNELCPPQMEVSPQGQVYIQMPPDTYYHDGGCSVPPYQADFMENPPPPYISEGPDYVAFNPDGSFTVEPPPSMTVNAEAGTITMSTATFQEEFNDKSGEMQLHSDGTADIKVPEGTQFNPATGTLSFPTGSVQMHEIPPQVNPMLNDDGSISVKLPEGISYNAADGTVHLNNQWLNELVPQPVTFNMDGTVVVDLPDDTQYFPNGTMVISADSAHFMDGGHGEYQQGQYPAPQYTGQYPYPEYQAQYPQYQPEGVAPIAPAGSTAA